MSQFFKPWRRKLGVIMLLMACMFAAGWIKSIRHADFVIFYSLWPNHAVLSGFGHFRIFQLGKYTFAIDGVDEGIKVSYTFHQWSPLLETPQWPPVFRAGKAEASHYRCDVFEVYDDSTGTRRPMWLIPYWSVVVPLTLMSAYLLLRKPRTVTKAEQQTAESSHGRIL